MSGLIALAISTPERLVVEAEVRSVRAMDESGSFGLLPGHADLLTVLPPSVLRWRDAAGAEGFCALRGGVLTMTGGRHLAIACRKALPGGRLEALEDDVIAAGAAEEEAARNARVAEARVHAQAMRQLMRFLTADGADGLGDLFAGGAA
ncbi:MAG TPA: F0F1 ATP synthase subunit epsilon [Novosphingobium sp.]|nr:F0F1 ATP synthase subunit epsilon [Novosphingobium sp.]